MGQCREIKHTLSGGKQIYLCELLEYRGGFGMLRYVIDREYTIAGHTLLPGDVTYGLYWEDRPYTLYVWDLVRIDSRLYYFNIADRISLRPEAFVWRDLAIDVLIDGDGRVDILDEQELPPDTGRELLAFIRSSVDLVVSCRRELITEADERVDEVGRASPG